MLPARRPTVAIPGLEVAGGVERDLGLEARDMRIDADAGEVIVRQGDEGDYFYIVKSGRLAVTEESS